MISLLEILVFFKREICIIVIIFYICKIIMNLNVYYFYVKGYKSIRGFLLFINSNLNIVWYLYVRIVVNYYWYNLKCRGW